MNIPFVEYPLGPKGNSSLEHPVGIPTMKILYTIVLYRTCQFEIGRDYHVNFDAIAKTIKEDHFLANFVIDGYCYLETACHKLFPLDRST